ncbi:MAG: hypothetical protein KatS3mg129_0681 [Leptospiraceae bacterium]|nr:MAG: hypothetical protein KatS3mg129_0681 [Leptospiraceae bacterium]
MKTIKITLTIFILGIVIFPINAGQFGLKFGYMAFNTELWNPDIQKRIFRDDLIIGYKDTSNLGTFTFPFQSDTNFFYPFSIYLQPSNWNRNFFIQADFYQFKKTNLRGNGIGFINQNINSIIFHEIKHIREQATLKLGFNLMSRGINDGFFDLILLAGGSWTHHGYGKNAVGYSNTGLTFVSNQHGSFDARIFNPLIGVEFAIPLSRYYRKTFFLYGSYESYPERSNKINYILNHFIFSGNNIDINIENIESDYSLSKQFYELGFGYYLAKDFIIKLSYRKEVNLIKYKNYNGYTLSFNNQIQNITDIFNLAELLSDKFFVYNGTNKEQIEGIYIGFEKAITY